MTAQRATIFEYPQIEAMRRAYYAERGLMVARRSADTVWLVVRAGARVLACASQLDVGDERLMQDYYCVKARDGIRALRVLRDAIYAEADAAHRRLVITCEPTNTAMLRAYGWKLTLTPTHHRQGLVPRAVIMVREPREDG